MRMNRGSIILIVALVVVFVAAVLISNQQASAPGTPTSTPNPESGKLFADIDSAGVVAHYELRRASDGYYADLRRLDAENWSFDGTSEDETRTPESSLIESTAGQLVGLEYTSSFETDRLADFGLDHPQFALFVETGTGEGYTLYVGNKAPTNPRYYVVLEPGIAESAASPSPEGTAEATVEATVEATSEATAEATSEATAEVIAPTPTTDPFFDVLPPPGAIRDANFTLTGTKTVYIIPQTVLTTMLGWLTTPPYQPIPTATVPPLPTLTPEFTPEATVEATTEATAEAAVEAAPDAEITPEATAAS